MQNFPNVIKIGLTRRTPDVRVREIYVGASGVPLPFEVAVAYSVANCELAEKRAHKLLKQYRINKRREFFRFSPSVGSSIVHQVCTQINSELGIASPKKFEFPGISSSNSRLDTVLNEDEDATGNQVVFNVAFSRLTESPVGTSTLSEEQAQRAEVLYQVLTKINPVARDKWIEGFTRDECPERELRIWEHMAKAYLTLEYEDEAPEEYRAEAFNLLLKRTWSTAAEVMADITIKHFSQATAKRLLDAYELRPKPLVIRGGGRV